MCFDFLSACYCKVCFLVFGATEPGQRSTLTVWRMWGMSGKAIFWPDYPQSITVSESCWIGHRSKKYWHREGFQMKRKSYKVLERKRNRKLVTIATTQNTSHKNKFYFVWSLKFRWLRVFPPEESHPNAFRMWCSNQHVDSYSVYLFGKTTVPRHFL